ncbi:MAG: alcohol dehydrogenase (cytochrome c) [Congregibacter sp.]|jgi:alcohol dehydrogenase (cytochrome c)
MKISLRRSRAIAAIMLCGSGVALAQSPAEIVYADQCASCHSASLRGSAHGSPLTGVAFVSKWKDRSAQELFDYVRTQMPPGQTASLSLHQHRQLTEFLIASNAQDLGDSQLVSTSVELPEQEEGQVEWSGSDAIDQLAKSAGNFTNQTLEDYQAVSSKMLATPPKGDWLSWRRTLDGHAHSPLKQINRSNVGGLQLRWSLSMSDGSNQITPLVHDGVMFLTHPGNRIQALDAATGTLMWDYQYDYPPGSKMLGGPTRNIAIYEDKLFMATYDAALVAIDARTGRQVWKSIKADYHQAYTHSAGPIIADGVVVSGINGCELFTEDGCFITGHDPDSGEELWRTSTLALPGTDEYASWGDIEPDRRGGGDSWIAGSYDPELELFFLGTSQAKPWVAASRGMSVEDDALYTNSTLALNPHTGEIVWYFQHIPGETIDMEVGFERILATIDGQKVLLTIGKDGILWKLDRKSGEFRALLDTLDQTIFESVDKSTGALRYRKDIREAKIGDSFTACPGIYGGHNWQASAYDASKNRLFIPLHQLCSTMTPREVDLGPGGGGYGADSVTYPMPGKENATGKLLAVDAKTMQPLWAHEQPVIYLSGALSTAGNLVFIGDVDRYFKAYDADSGEVLWSTRLGAAAHGYPISYAVGDRQFIAVPAGIGVFRALTALLYPNIYQPTGGQSIYVFELPQSHGSVISKQFD